MTELDKSKPWWCTNEL